MPARDLSYYRGKRVFLTGHTGFKGGWLAVWLQRLGAEVRGYGLAPNTLPNLYEALSLQDRMESIPADVRDLPRLQKEMRQFQPDVVFHLAAQSLVRQSYQTPVETFEINVMGTAKLLEAVRGCESVRTCVIITSDKCYENKEWVYSYRENDPMGGYDPYSASKGATELVINSYRLSFFNRNQKKDGQCGVASARAGNVIGGGDWARDRLIPDCIRNLREGKPILLRNPGAIRPWQHVMEPLYGYLCLGAALAQDREGFASAWNFGPAHSDASVRMITEMLIREWGSGTWQDVSDPNQDHEASCLHLDSTKANTLLSWYSALEVEEAVALTAAWFKRYYEDGDMWKFTNAQIDYYAEIAERKSKRCCVIP